MSTSAAAWPQFTPRSLSELYWSSDSKSEAKSDAREAKSKPEELEGGPDEGLESSASSILSTVGQVRFAPVGLLELLLGVCVFER